MESDNIWLTSLKLELAYFSGRAWWGEIENRGAGAILRFQRVRPVTLAPGTTLYEAAGCWWRERADALREAEVEPLGARLEAVEVEEVEVTVRVRSALSCVSITGSLRPLFEGAEEPGGTEGRSEGESLRLFGVVLRLLDVVKRPKVEAKMEGERREGCCCSSCG